MWGTGLHDLKNGLKFSIKHSFGNYQMPIQKNPMFTGEDTLIYLAGKHFVEYDLIRRRQSYILKKIEDNIVTCMNHFLSKTKLLYIAIGLHDDSGAVYPSVPYPTTSPMM